MPKKTKTSQHTGHADQDVGEQQPPQQQQEQNPMGSCLTPARAEPEIPPVPPVPTVAEQNQQQGPQGLFGTATSLINMGGEMITRAKDFMQPGGSYFGPNTQGSDSAFGRIEPIEFGTGPVMTTKTTTEWSDKKSGRMAKHENVLTEMSTHNEMPDYMKSIMGENSKQNLGKMSNNGPLKDTKKTQEHDATLGIDVKKQMVGIAQKMKTTEEASYYPPKELIEACGGDAEIARAIFCSDQQKQIRNNEQKQIQDN